MSVVIFKQKVLNGTFRPSQPLLLTSGEMTLFWSVVASAGPTTLQFYLEFSDDQVTWFQEVDEQDTGSGVVKMSKAIRTFYENGGAALANGTHKLSTQFVRKAPFARVQARVTAGAAQINVTAPAGSIASAPAP